MLFAADSSPGILEAFFTTLTYLYLWFSGSIYVSTCCSLQKKQSEGLKSSRIHKTSPTVPFFPQWILRPCSQPFLSYELHKLGSCNVGEAQNLQPAPDACWILLNPFQMLVESRLRTFWTVKVLGKVLLLLFPLQCKRLWSSFPRTLSNFLLCSTLVALVCSVLVANLSDDLFSLSAAILVIVSASVLRRALHWQFSCVTSAIAKWWSKHV